jgi:hypothetical protein
MEEKTKAYGILLFVFGLFIGKSNMKERRFFGWKIIFVTNFVLVSSKS